MTTAWAPIRKSGTNPGVCAAARPASLKSLARQQRSGPGIGLATKPPSERKLSTSLIQVNRTDGPA